MKRRFSYLLVCFSYPPVLGGSEIEAQRVSTELQNRGHRVKILCSGGAPMPPVSHWLDPFGIRVQILGRHWPARLRWYVFALGTMWVLFKERKNYEIAYFLMQGLHVVTGLPVARLLGKRIVMKFSCSGQVIQMQNSWVGRLELKLLRRWASSILVLNPGMEQEALDVGFDAARIGWMPNPIDTDEFSPCDPGKRLEIRNELGIGADTPLVVFVGRLDHQKKVPWLLGAFAKVVRQSPQVKLAIVGDGPLRAQFHELTSSLGLEKNVIFTGRLGSDGVLKWLRAGDVYTLISAVEGLPCSLIEAMSAGIAPVVSDIPAHTQIVEHEGDGLITALGDEESVAGGLLRLVNDPQLRQRLGASARRRILAQFSTAQVGDSYEKLFAEVLSSGR